jgi:glycosyltransferase involved in cell wall biosynthesis
LGTIEPRKNILSLIAAYEKLTPEERDLYQLVIAGRIGWNCDAEKKRLHELAGSKRILHVGYVSDKERAILFQTAEYFVHASHYEGFGMPLLEAMSYGTPCVVSDIPVFHEVAGSAATYFDHKSVDDIAAKLHPLLRNSAQREQLSKAAAARVDIFSWDTIARTMHAQISQAVTGAQAPQP